MHDSREMHELADESVQFCMTNTDAWEPLYSCIPEIYRTLRKDGVFVFNMGQVPVQSGAYERMKKDGHERRMPLLPYIVADMILDRADFTLQEVFICLRNYGIKPRRWIANYEHYFLYSKTDEYRMWTVTPLMSAFSVEEVPTPDRMPKHFNTEIVKSFLETFTEHGSLVLDPMAGTGPFGRIAKTMGRRVVLYEIDTGLEQEIRKNLGEITVTA